MSPRPDLSDPVARMKLESRKVMLAEVLQWARANKDIQVGKVGWQTHKEKPAESLDEWQLLEQRATLRIGFLFSEFHCACWYYEMVEMLRKLILTSVIIWMFEEPVTQVRCLIACVLVCAALLTLSPPLCS